MIAEVEPGFVAVVVLAALIAILILLWPSFAAHQRNHPNKDAIDILVFCSLIFAPCWIIALVWAYTKPRTVETDARRQLEIERAARRMLEDERAEAERARMRREQEREREHAEVEFLVQAEQAGKRRIDPVESEFRKWREEQAWEESMRELPK